MVSHPAWQGNVRSLLRLRQGSIASGLADVLSGLPVNKPG
jgi:hypothetical protein